MLLNTPPLFLFISHLDLFLPLQQYLPPIFINFLLSNPPPPCVIQAEQGIKMECVQGALKSSFTRPEMVLLKPTQQAFLDDLWTVNNNGQTGGSDDDFFVDDLLDFSKAVEEEQSEKDREEKTFLLEDKPLDYNEDKTVFLSPQQQQQADNVKDFSGSVHGSELCVPADDLADLEWLSNFVDDSSSAYSLTLPAGKLPVKPSSGNCSDPEVAGSEKPILATPVQTKARSKRARTGVRVWSLGSHSLTDSSTSSSSSLSSPLNPWVTYNDLGQTAESLFGKPLAKKQKRKPAGDTSGGGGGTQPRRCSHCYVQKTPQWRTGPLGAKTLCNACGVRFKSGRLLPEYRPACSPTFSSEIHSNNHRKVLEMRRKKEGGDGFGTPVKVFEEYSPSGVIV